VPILKAILVIIEIVTCFLLVTLILIQKTKSQGAGMAFGASMGESLFGAQTGNVLTKVTVWLTIIFLINTTVLALMTPGKAASATDTVTSRIPVSAAPANRPPMAQPKPRAQAPAGEVPTAASDWQKTAPAAPAPVSVPAAPSADVPVEQPAK
jgi:preprotein translocase subunit SecG